MKNFKPIFKNHKDNKFYYLSIFDNNKLCGYIQYKKLNKLSIDFFENIEDFYSFEDIIGKNKTIYLSYIVIEDNYRGLGISNLLMEEFNKIWKKHFNYCFLNACPFNYGKKKPLVISKLKKFYEKYNFETVVDYGENIYMINIK